MSTTINDISPSRLTPEDLKTLAETSENPCVSILMPTHRSGPETRQNAIRFKNLLGEAKQKLEDAGHDCSILEPLESLSTNFDFWQHQKEGLAIFLTSDQRRVFLVDRTVPASVSVADEFFVLPLLRSGEDAERPLVLSLTWDSANLYRFDGESLESMPTEMLPAKFHDLVLPRDPEENLQNTSHRSHGNAGATSTAMFHGHGEGEDKIEADRRQYLSIVGDQVAGAVYDSGSPLALVATTEVAGHFEAATDVRVDAKIEGSSSQWSDEELRERVCQTLSIDHKAVEQDTAERFAAAIAQGSGSDDVSEITAAAANRRVDSVMVCVDNLEAAELNSIVVDTLRHGGSAFRCAAEKMPGNATVAAIFRY
ncbi:hypothetical protein Mal15_24810 [Stieleria maiorica]|uniref:Uncharacterized protein n=1 Tax=Stieleria maiorica TaxID=2795974 RepID=A0A5B9MD34_9BACT|nr:hypothetical protein [Stieleria maiorica]QEF98429.1 hypothetical protein Mal15_24810 [Stieleria maiorica]